MFAGRCKYTEIVKRVDACRSMFAMPECGIGLFVDIGSAYFLSRLPGEMGMYLALTGQRLKGHPSFNACRVRSMLCYQILFQQSS